MPEAITTCNSATNQRVVSIEGARKSFGDTEALKGITLEVKRGEVVAIIGASGGGKSTLLRCMTLLEKLDGGSLSYGDVRVAADDGSGCSRYGDAAVLKAARQRFGLVFQAYNLFPHMSVLHNVTDAPHPRTAPQQGRGGGPGARAPRKDGPHRQREQGSLPALRRPAAAREHRTRPCHEPRGALLRRAHKRA